MTEFSIRVHTQTSRLTYRITNADGEWVDMTIVQIDGEPPRIVDFDYHRLPDESPQDYNKFVDWLAVRESGDYALLRSGRWAMIEELCAHLMIKVPPMPGTPAGEGFTW